MRLQDWTEDVIRFQRSAAEYTGYFEALARAVRPHLAGRRRLCDAGCGMGYLGAALARDFDTVDALDRNPRAIAAARSVVAERGLTNVRARVADVMGPPHFRSAGKSPTMPWCSARWLPWRRLCAPPFDAARALS